MSALPGNSASECQPRGWLRAAWYGCCAGLLAALGVQLWHITLGNNFRTVVPGQVYRCAQLTEAELEQAIRRHGIRTVINLRGMGVGCDWYLDESRATARCDASQEDVNFSAGRLPPTSELRLLLRALDHGEYPILVHCRQGVDRTGLVSALVLLLYTDATLDDARQELRLCYGHVPLGRTVRMHGFFDLYEDWLKQQGVPHDRAR
ncbi:MAG: tyrosine-protein phosphatase, partial [Planctomycetia bacterium]|nr:tyrosine-protein phosphatase [Planctomycetia bacterium]